VSQSLRLSALQRAALIAGGAQALSSKLQVRFARVDSWIDGQQPIPLEIFLKIIDMLLEDDLRSLRSSVIQTRSAPRALPR
jgi:DNA-binding transcriptional regulator YdaS (Cro superfamily)